MKRACLALALVVVVALVSAEDHGVEMMEEGGNAVKPMPSNVAQVRRCTLDPPDALPA